MQYLMQEYWSEFNSNGLLFESLVEEILALKYPNIKFNRTKITHDGSKDFESLVPILENEEEKIWTECKYWNDRLPINALSMTLLMAYIKDVRQLLIFSYSPVKDGFREHIAEYNERTKIPVHIYDDIRLEKLIFEFRPKMKNFNAFFPKYQTNDHEVFGDDKITCTYKLRRNFDDYYVPESLPRAITLNEVVTLDCYLFNPSDCAKSVEIRMPASDNRDRFELTNKIFVNNNFILTMKVAAHSSKFISFSMRLKQYGVDIKYPNIIAKFNDGSEQLYSIKEKLTCRWLADAPLIGDSYFQILQKSGELLASEDHVSVITLKGRSGVGKSRLLNELEFVALKTGKVLSSLDTENKSFTAKFFVQKIVSILSELPLYNHKHVGAVWSSSTNDDMSCGLRILYDEKLNVNNEKINIAKYLCDMLIKKPCVLLLDNVQNCDETTLEIINLLLDYLDDSKTSSTLVFSFNTDFVYSGTMVEGLLNRLDRLSEQYPVKYGLFEAQGFTRDEALLFLRECLTFNPKDQLDDISYDLVLDEIIKASELKPFYLKNYLLYLEQEMIIKRTLTTSFYISDISAFQKSLNEIPKTISSLLEIREKKFSTYLTTSDINYDDYKNFMALLGMTKEIPLILYLKLFKNFAILKELEAIGFIIRDELDKIQFSHKYFSIFFAKKFPYAEIPEGLLSDFLSYIKKLNFENDMFFPVFFVKHITNTLDNKTFVEALAKIKNWDVSCEFGIECFSIISNLLEAKKFKVEKKQYVDTYWNMDNMIVVRQGLYVSLHFDEKVYNQYIQHPTGFGQVIPEIQQFLGEYLCHLYNTGNITEGLDKCRKLIEITDSYLPECTKQKEMLAHLYIRETIGRYYLDDIENAEQSIGRALAMAESVEDWKAVIECHRTRGDIYYHHTNAGKYKATISKYWLQAYEKFHEYFSENESCNLQMKISTYIKAVLADLMRENLEAASLKMKYLSGRIGKTGMMYYEIQLRLLKNIFLLVRHDTMLQKKSDVFDEFIRLNDQAIDLCAINGNKRSYANCFYLRALAYLKIMKPDFAVDNFIKTYNIILKDSKNLTDTIGELNIARWRPFFIEMAIYANMEQDENLKAVLLKINNKEIKTEVLKIINMASNEFKAFTESYISQSPFYDSDKKWGIPMI